MIQKSIQCSVIPSIQLNFLSSHIKAFVTFRNIASCCCSVTQLCPTLWNLMDYTAQQASGHSLFPGVWSNSCPSSQWCHPAISSSVALFSCPWTFPMSRPFDQSTGTSASASALSMNIQGWFSLGLTGFVSLKSKRHSGLVSSTIAWKHQFFDALFAHFM